MDVWVGWVDALVVGGKMIERTNQMILCLKASASADRNCMFVFSESRAMTLHFDNGKVTAKESLVSY